MIMVVAALGTWKDDELILEPGSELLVEGTGRPVEEFEERDPTVPPSELSMEKEDKLLARPGTESLVEGADGPV